MLRSSAAPNHNSTDAASTTTPTYITLLRGIFKGYPKSGILSMQEIKRCRFDA